MDYPCAKFGGFSLVIFYHFWFYRLERQTDLFSKPQKAHPCTGSHLLTYFAWRSVLEPWLGSLKNQQEGWLSPTKRASAAKNNYSIIDYDVHDFLFVRHCNYSSVLYYLRVIWRWIINWLRGLSRSLKLMPFKSLCAVSYSPSIVTMAVFAAILEIFTVKEWPDLEIWVWGPSRSLKKARFDRPCMTFY